MNRPKTPVRNPRVGFTGPILLLLVLLGSGTARSADPVDNPHGAFREDCALCHLPDAWSPVKIGSDFDHSRFGFPLEGAHRDTPCLLCHLTLEFRETTGSECADCHQDVHLGELGIDCAACHSTRDFVDRSEGVRRHRASRFPLTGTHRTVDCAACHPPDRGAAMRFVNTPTECSECHLETYLATTSPDHEAAGIPTDCDRCHATTTWSGGSFDHALTGFPLTGAHRPLECQRCHTDFTFTALPSGCADCHLDDYQVAANPVHAPGFPTGCAQCHGTAAWRPASFDHSTTAFPLTGAHLAIDCTMCHTNGIYVGTPQDCYSCHAADYDGTSDPPHAASGFSFDCASCHDTNGWDGANFDHDGQFFPIYSGRHREAWNTCADCHVNQSNYAVFECIFCHEHSNENEVNNQHEGESGYQYLSTACLRCHPDGRN